MITREIIAIGIITVLGIGGGIGIFAGSQKESLKKREVFSMIAVGIIASVFSWTRIEENVELKKLVSIVLSITLISTILTKLIFNIIRAIINIPQEKLQKILIDLARKKVGLEKEENEETENENSEGSINSPDSPDNNGGVNMG